jgi:hypothetical protein
MKNKHLVALNKIKRKINCDFYDIQDFHEVCPLSLEELKQPNRLPFVVMWRFTGILWNLLCGKKEGEAAEYFGRDRTNVANVLENVDQAMIGWNEILMLNIRIVASHSRTKPKRLPKYIVRPSIIIARRKKLIDPRRRIWNVVEKHKMRASFMNDLSLLKKYSKYYPVELSETDCN